MADYRAEDSARTTPSDTPAKKTRATKATAVRTSGQLFDKDGLRALDAARAILARGPIRWGQDSRFWTYEAGVWAPGEDAIHARIVQVLGNRYRPAHGNAIRDVTRALVPTIDCTPTPEYINFRNGLLRWQTGELIPHDPEIPSTVQLEIDWDPNAQCPEFHAFLTDVIPDDDKARVWEVLGYMLMSGNPLHRAFLLAGGGRNGKGAFMRTILAILGKDNVSHVPLHDFSANRFATAQLYGRMANVCGDIDATYMENTGKFKEAVGEDAINAEHKFGQPFRFTAWCSMLFSANSIPGSADSSKGWVDRWEVIRFPKYVGDRVDKTLEPRLQSQASLQGIAVCAVAALRVLMSRGSFRVTETSIEAKEEFARKSNPLYAWLDERATVTKDAADFEKGMVLYNDYRDWAVEVLGQKQALSRNNFYEKLRQLEDRGVTGTKRNGTDGFKGIKLGKVDA